MSGRIIRFRPRPWSARLTCGLSITRRCSGRIGLTFWRLPRKRCAEVEHARAHQYAKRGGGAQTLSLEDAPILCAEPAPDILALDEALQELESMDARKCRIVEFKFLGGLSTEETAAVLAISTATVEREWRAAKAWLYQAMTEGHS